jgi:hypothetical protein
MTKYQLMNEVEKRLVITEINHSLLYDSEAFKQIMSIVKQSNPIKSIKLFPNENQVN